MSRKIRFALDMKDNIEVRTIEELRENFSLEKLLQHIASGKLVTWLRDRYLDDIADKIEALDTSDSDYNRKICEIFDVAYDDTSEADYEKAEEHNRKLSLLKAVSDEQEYLDNVDKVAFEQDDIYDLLDDGETTIYLCGEKFSIPLSKCGIKYIGINKPVVIIDSKEPVDWNNKRIMLKNVRCDDNYREVEANFQQSIKISKYSSSINEMGEVYNPPKTRICSRCGAECNINNEFCDYCGSVFMSTNRANQNKTTSVNSTDGNMAGGGLLRSMLLAGMDGFK